MRKIVLAIAVGAAALLGGTAANAANSVKTDAVTNGISQSTDFSSAHRRYRHSGHRRIYRSYGYYAPRRVYYTQPYYEQPYYRGGYGYGYGGPIIGLGFGGFGGHYGGFGGGFGGHHGGHH